MFSKFIILLCLASTVCAFGSENKTFLPVNKKTSNKLSEKCEPNLDLYLDREDYFKIALMEYKGIFKSKAHDLQSSYRLMAIMLKSVQSRGYSTDDDIIMFKKWLQLFNDKNLEIVSEHNFGKSHDDLLKDARVLVPVFLKNCDASILWIIETSYLLSKTGILKLDPKSDLPWIRNLKTLRHTSRRISLNNRDPSEYFLSLIEVRNNCFLLDLCH